MIETDVLIIGTGPAGSACAALLSKYGIPNIVVEKYRWMANTPRAHITNQRAMEVFRDLDIEDEVIAKATPQELMANNVFCESLAGEEIGRLYSWGNHPKRKAQYDMASPTRVCDIPQDLLEPILFGKACESGTVARLYTEFESFEQDADGVTTVVRDRASGESYQIRSKYLVGADGGNSMVAEQLGLPMEGKMGVAGSINIVFKADLSRYVAHRPSVLYWVLQPGSDVGGIGMGLVRMVRPWDRWLVVWGYDINEPPPEVTDEMAIDILHNLIGDDSIDIEIESTSTWTVNDMYATKLSEGRVFCVGDAVHRHPPSNGLGSNTSIQDSYNLAWKLAHVLKGVAGEELLETYDQERAPIAKQIVTRANQSIAEFGPIFEALGLGEGVDPEVMQSNMDARKQATEEAATQREDLRKAILFKSYEFNCHGVEMNQFYTSSAVLRAPGDGVLECDDIELHYAESTIPGAHVPHCWFEVDGAKVATVDLCCDGRFALLTGIGGEAWVEAVEAVEHELGVEIVPWVIGPGRDATDLYGEWPDQRGTAESGALLVRPDGHIAWRHADEAPETPEATSTLMEAITSLLGR